MITKNIKEIIGIQNYCSEIIQELYRYESRPYNIITKDIKNINKLEEAIKLEIIEYDSFDDKLSLSIDTEEYYRKRLGQYNETNIGEIGDKLKKFQELLKVYDIRQKSNENGFIEIKEIYKLLNKIPYIFRQNFQSISSISIFTFKNESNFEIKMRNLKKCREEINQLSRALEEVDKIIDEESNFLRSMNSRKINFVVSKIKKNSADFERFFAQLYNDIIYFINQSIRDGEFIKHIKKLKKLKLDNTLIENTNIENLLDNKLPIISGVKEHKILADDEVYIYVEQIQASLKERKKAFINNYQISSIDYDITKNVNIPKKLYNYTKIYQDFLKQDKDLISFLSNYSIKIEKEKIMGVFMRLLKYHSYNHVIDNEEFIQIGDRLYLKVYSKEGKDSVN
jgi:hypothetical protein